MVFLAPPRFVPTLVGGREYGGDSGMLSVSPCIAYTLLQEIPPREIASREIASRLHLPRPSQVLCSPVGPLPCLPISLAGSPKPQNPMGVLEI